ncbi:MAG TPA: ABC transporter ATP-binding protein/permease [Candidatus Mediterraneibacter vanvlietii]|nr:ABC transporter ATP-binding protein/permease [Candidatus Mediterraneibacter vanvlietii]
MIKTRLMKLLKGSGKYIGWNIFWQWIALLFQIASVCSAGYLIEQLYGKRLGTDTILGTALIVAAAIIARYVCERKAARASYRASADVKKVLRHKIYEKLLRLGASYKERVPTSEVVQVSTEGVEQLEVYYGRYLPQLFYSLLAPVTLFIVLSRFSVKACVVLLVCVPLIPLSIVAVQKFAKKLLNKYWGIYTELGDSFLENLQGLTTLKIYQADGMKAKEMDEESERFRKITMKVLTMQLNSVSVMDIVAYGGAAVGMIVTVREFMAGNVGLAGAFSLILLASEFFIPLRLLGSFFHIAMNGMSASDKIFRILDLEETSDGNRPLEGSKIAVKMSGVSFGYEQERKVLNDISLDIPSGSFVALVGVSGCGKSTIASLITGRNKGFSGEISINGIPIGEIAEQDLMRRITLVRHNSYLFKGTVEENLRMGNPKAGREEMETALKKVNLYEFLEQQDGLDTRLEEQGSNLSGGQRQRLSIARALLADSPMYIFDEAASNIDVESEEQIMGVIRELAKTKTVLFISHRLSNAMSADRIYMLENGRITESGTHEELMEQERSREGKEEGKYAGKYAEKNTERGGYARMFEEQRRLCEYREEAAV